MTTPIGSRMEPAAPARSLCVGGPGGIPTIVPVGAPLAYDLRAELLPDCCWWMTWRALEVGAEDADSTTHLGNGR